MINNILNPISLFFFRNLYKFKKISFFQKILPLALRKKISTAIFHKAFINVRNLEVSVLKQRGLKYGINVLGCLNAELGVGEAARSTLRACKAAEIPAAAINFKEGVISRLNEKIPEGFDSTPLYRTTLIHLNGDSTARAIESNEKLFHNYYTIAYWNWELPEVPDSWLEYIHFLNEVWAPSLFCAKAFSRKLKIPVVHIPYSIHVDVPQNIGRKELGIPENGFVFLFVFDIFSIYQRKNPMAVIDAYLRAKPSFNDKTYLVIKMINGEKETSLTAQIHSSRDREPSIIPFSKYLLRPELNALFNTADCYVSLHRSEGFGFTIAESMFLGKPVIATGWSSNMDFMTQRNSIPVPYRLVQLDQNYGPYAQGQWWADPNIDAAAAAMVMVANNPDFAHLLGERAKHEIREKYSPFAIGKIIRNRLAVLENQ